MTTATSAEKPIPEDVGRELIDVSDVARMCCCSEKHIHRLRDAGRMPQPLKLGALVRWRRADVLEWIGNGCPNVRQRVGRR